MENPETTPSIPQIASLRTDFSRAFQYYLDRSTPHIPQRWLGTLVVAIIYVLRVYLVKGFYVISYGLGIYILNLLIGFMSPKVDPELEALDGAALPTKDSDEFRPFVRRLPEFKFWYSITKAFLVAFGLTFLSVLDVPVFWPILLCYWIVLFALTMKRQISHMIKYKYIPFDFGKQVFFQPFSGWSNYVITVTSSLGMLLAFLEVTYIYFISWLRVVDRGTMERVPPEAGSDAAGPSSQSNRSN